MSMLTIFCFCPSPSMPVVRPEPGEILRIQLFSCTYTCAADADFTVVVAAAVDDRAETETFTTDSKVFASEQ